jgi:hypothetical protein
MPDDMIELASEAFDKDRRFHLDPCYDKEAARDVIEAYIDHHMSTEFFVYSALYNDKLAGFMLMKSSLQPEPQVSLRVRCSHMMPYITRHYIRVTE